MIGYTVQNTAGNVTFIPTDCEYCILDSGMNHALNCPYRLFDIKKEHKNDNR